MKLNKSIILILCLLFGTSIANAATPYARASISATATVIPMLGVMPNIDKSQSLSFSKISDSKLLIQAPKNSVLLIHVKNVNQKVRCTGILNYETLSTKKNAVSDFFTYDISKIESQQTITILTIDN